MKKFVWILPVFALLHFVPVENGLKFLGDWPKIPFYVNPAIPGDRIGGTDALMVSMRNAAALWSSSTTNVRFDFRVSGFTDRSQPFAPPSLDCSAQTIAAFGQTEKAVFASAAESPDCTGVACTFVWSCDGDSHITHFDIMLNAAGRSFATANLQGNDYDIRKVVARSLGHIAGLDYCPAGYTPNQCNAKIGSGQSDPPEGSLMYRLLLPGAGGAAGADEIAGMQNLYAVLTPQDLARILDSQKFLQHVDQLCTEFGCLLPESETNPTYQLVQSERDDVAEHDTKILQNGFADPIQRLGSVKFDAMLHDESTDPTHPQTAEQILQNALDKRAEIAQRMETDRLNAARHVVTVQIKQKKAEIDEFTNQLDLSYLNFMNADLRSMILIRKAIIDEQNRR